MKNKFTPNGNYFLTLKNIGKNVVKFNGKFNRDILRNDLNTFFNSKHLFF